MFLCLADGLGFWANKQFFFRPPGKERVAVLLLGGKSCCPVAGCNSYRL